MHKAILGKYLNILAIVSFLIAGIIYIVTGIGRVPFWFIEAGMVLALASVTLLHGDKTTSKKPFKILNYLFILIPIVIFIGVILYVILLGYAFGHSDWQF